jgi:hypothetical protein
MCGEVLDMTNEYKEKIVDIVTSEVSWRDYSEAEIKAHNETKARLKAEKEAEDAKLAARLAILEKLGLTDAEAKVLLG